MVQLFQQRLSPDGKMQESNSCSVHKSRFPTGLLCVLDSERSGSNSREGMSLPARVRGSGQRAKASVFPVLTQADSRRCDPDLR